MHPKLKIFLIGFFPSSLIFTLLMAILDMIADGEFYPYKLLFHFIFFGTFMGFMMVYNYNKQQKRKDKQQ